MLCTNSKNLGVNEPAHPDKFEGFIVVLDSKGVNAKVCVSCGKQSTCGAYMTMVKIKALTCRGNRRDAYVADVFFIEKTRGRRGPRGQNQY